MQTFNKLKIFLLYDIFFFFTYLYSGFKGEKSENYNGSSFLKIPQFLLMKKKLQDVEKGEILKREFKKKESSVCEI